MDIEAWQVLVGLTVVVVVFGFGVVVLGAPASASGLVIIVGGGVIGILGGRFIAERYL
jgi:hypothetical protein